MDTCENCKRLVEEVQRLTGENLELKARLEAENKAGDLICWKRKIFLTECKRRIPDGK